MLGFALTLQAVRVNAQGPNTLVAPLVGPVQADGTKTDPSHDADVQFVVQQVNRCHADQEGGATEAELRKSYGNDIYKLCVPGDEDGRPLIVIRDTIKPAAVTAPSLAILRVAQKETSEDVSGFLLRYGVDKSVAKQLGPQLAKMLQNTPARTILVAVAGGGTAISCTS